MYRASQKDRIAAAPSEARMNRQRRILMITRNFPPTLGGMERLAHHTYLELSKEFEVWLLGPPGSGLYVADRTRVVECRTRPLLSFLSCLQWQAKRIARRVNPDLVLASSGISALAATAAARVSGVAAITYVHGLDIVVDSFLYGAFFLPAIRRSDRVIANSRYTAELACGKGVAKDAIEILRPGVATQSKQKVLKNGGFRTRYGLNGRKLLLSVGRLLPRKGLPEFIHNVLPKLVATHRDILLVIIGEEPRQALAASPGELQRIHEAALSARMKEHIAILGVVDDDMLDQAYVESDLFVFPIVETTGDVEGFGMVALEAAAHGLPTVAFAVGGVSDAVNDGVSGYLVPPGNFEQFARMILQYLDRSDRADWESRCLEHAREFSWDKYGAELRKICNETIEGRMEQPHRRTN